MSAIKPNLIGDIHVNEEAQKALAALREGFEAMQKGMVTEAAFKELEEKTSKVLDKQEESNQKALLEFKAKEKEVEELKGALGKLEDRLIGMSSTGHKDFRGGNEYKAFIKAVTKNDASEYEAHFKSLNRTDIDTQGGYLIPQILSTELIKSLSEISPIRKLARVTMIDGKSLSIPVRKSLLTATYEGESELNAKSSSGYGQETVTPYRLSATVEVTRDMLMDAVFDFENEVMNDAREAFALAEGLAFVQGSGIKKPEGIIVNSSVIANARDTASSTTLAFDDLINLSGDLKTGYNGIYSFNRVTNAYLRTLKGTDGQYLWQLQSNGTFNTLNGYNYVVDNQMPNYGSGTTATAGVIPVIFGDFAKGYRIIDRTDMVVVRDDVTRKAEGIVEFAFMRWNSGKVVLPEAIKALKIKA
jgi:HK97 family phage major capsid protein